MTKKRNNTASQKLDASTFMPANKLDITDEHVVDIDGMPALKKCPVCKKDNLTAKAMSGRCYSCGFDVVRYLSEQRD